MTITVDSILLAKITAQNDSRRNHPVSPRHGFVPADAPNIPERSLCSLRAVKPARFVNNAAPLTSFRPCR